MVKKHLVEIVTDACLFWLPIDLLYLYFAGGWYESNEVILYTELAVLFGLPLLAGWRVWQYRREYKS